MIQALEFMNKLNPKPILIANHPSRSAQEGKQYGLDDPAELRKWNDTAPEVSVGMAGAPGHQASTLNPDNTPKPEGFRGGYSQLPTRGGFDPMTAGLGGFWDSMLGEGRHWWITANSDSHVHYTEGGSDFWPGEFSKTYVHAEKSYDAILDGIRSGRVFVTTGDLISELDVSAQFGSKTAQIGGSLEVSSGTDIGITIKLRDLRDPEKTNHHKDNPIVIRVDLIIGKVTVHPVNGEVPPVKGRPWKLPHYANRGKTSSSGGELASARSCFSTVRTALGKLRITGLLARFDVARSFPQFPRPLLLQPTIWTSERGADLGSGRCQPRPHLPIYRMTQSYWVRP